MADTTHCPGVLVVELGTPLPTGALLPTEVASALVDHVAADLARLVPDATSLDLALSGAPLDPAQVLRPGWPVFAALAVALARTRRSAGPRIVAFGGAGGRMVARELEADPTIPPGPLVVLPFVLAGAADAAQRTGVQLEDVLHERGLAAAAVPLLLAQALDVEVVHARYFTHHDLAALVAIQLDHAGCAPAWTLLESALFAPGRAVAVVAASGQDWALAGDVAHATVLGVRDWLAGPGADVAPDARPAAFAAWQVAQRRHAALFTAHGLRVGWRDGTRGGAPLRDPWLLVSAGRDADGPLRLIAHEAADLGTYAFSAMRGTRAVASCYPLAAAALGAARDALCAAVAAPPGTAVARSSALPEL